MKWDPGTGKRKEVLGERGIGRWSDWRSGGGSFSPLLTSVPVTSMKPLLAIAFCGRTRRERRRNWRRRR